MWISKTFFGVKHNPDYLSVNDAKDIVLTIPEGCETIDGAAFGEEYYEGDYERGGYVDRCSMPELAIINLPASMKNINKYEHKPWMCRGQVDYYSPFYFLPNLKEINVHPDNPYFTSVDGVLYNKDMTEILGFPRKSPLKEWTTPKTLTKLPYSILWGNDNLEKLTIEENIKEIEPSAVRETNIKEVRINSQDINISYANFNLIMKFYAPQALAGYFAREYIKNIVWTDRRKSSDEKYVADERDVEETEDGFKILHIPEGAKYFDTNAFWYHKEFRGGSGPVTTYWWNDVPRIEKIKTINIPSTFQSIGCNSFPFCDYLEKVNVDENNPYYMSEKGVVYTKDKSQLVFIPPYNSIETFHIPKSMKEIDPGALGSIAEVTVDSNHELYTVQDGVLFSKDMTKLIYYPRMKDGNSWTCPESVISFESKCFYKPIYLSNIIIPKSDKTFTLNNGFLVDYGIGLYSITLGAKKTIIPDRYNFNNFSKVILSIKDPLQFVIDKSKIEYLEKQK